MSDADVLASVREIERLGQSILEKIEERGRLINEIAAELGIDVDRENDRPATAGSEEA